jgi:uncharacterized protein YlxP (DUF503 family)
MVIGSLRLVVRIHGCRSLKEKRRPRQRITERIRNKFRVAVAEVDSQDVWDLLTLGVAAVGPDRIAVERVLKQVAEFVADFGEGELIEDVIELDLR